MNKLNDLIPPDVTVSPATASQILSRAMQDENGWFDPLVEPIRAYNAFQLIIAELKLELQNAVQG